MVCATRSSSKSEGAESQELIPPVRTRVGCFHSSILIFLLFCGLSLPYILFVDYILCREGLRPQGAPHQHDALAGLQQ